MSMSEAMSETEGSPVVEWEGGGETYLFKWLQAGYDELVEQTRILESFNSKMTFFAIILTLVIIGSILSFLFGL